MSCAHYQDEYSRLSCPYPADNLPCDSATPAHKALRAVIPPLNPDRHKTDRKAYMAAYREKNREKVNAWALASARRKRAERREKIASERSADEARTHGEGTGRE